jgi:hypothetical protein
VEFQSQSIGDAQGHCHYAPQQVKERFVWKTKMNGGDAYGCRGIAFHVQGPILLAGYAFCVGVVARPDQKHDPLLLALDVFGSRHPKVKIGFQLLVLLLLLLCVFDERMDVE